MASFIPFCRTRQMMITGTRIIWNNTNDRCTGCRRRFVIDTRFPTQRCSFASSSSGRIPEPTWSVRDLRLTDDHPPLPGEEVRRLSRRALIHIDRDDDEARRDLANMMHMVEQLSERSALWSSSSFGDTATDNDNDDSIYDMVRGVTAARH
jgi:hypothetical protein